jgi:hypothetical protein
MRAVALDQRDGDAIACAELVAQRCREFQATRAATDDCDAM